MCDFLPQEELIESEVAARILPDGRRVCIVQMTYGKFRINVCEKDTAYFYSHQY